MKNFLKKIPWLHGAVTGLRRVYKQTSIKIIAFILRRQRRARVIVIIGMRRTGNHVVVNWIKNQHRGLFLFCNNVSEGQYPLDRRVKEFRWRFGGRPIVMCSYEDVPLEKVFTPELDQFVKDFGADPADSRTILILRDPHNIFASRAKRWPEALTDDAKRSEMLSLWKSYAASFTEKTFPATGVPIAINYNKFVRDRDYRKGLSEKLDLVFTDKGFDEVTHYGHGSSFDGVSYTKGAERMDVFERWRVFKDDPNFRALFDDEEIRALGNEIFGMAPTFEDNTPVEGAQR